LGALLGWIADSYRQALVPMAGGQMKNPMKLRTDWSNRSRAPRAQIFYPGRWFGAPWLKPEPALFLHGNSETSEIWYGWVPRMGAALPPVSSRDLPGFGRSTVPSILNGPWQITRRPVAEFLDAMGIESAHINRAKTGGAVAMQFAATYPQRTAHTRGCQRPFGPVDPKF